MIRLMLFVDWDKADERKKGSKIYVWVRSLLISLPDQMACTHVCPRPNEMLAGVDK
jgi:hypothetical protein